MEKMIHFQGNMTAAQYIMVVWFLFSGTMKVTSRFIKTSDEGQPVLLELLTNKQK